MSGRGQPRVYKKIGGSRRGQGGSQQPWYAAPPTRGEAKQYAYLETQPEYAPVKRQLQAERRASGQRVKQVGNWWNQYLQNVSAQQANTQAAYAAANQQTQDLINTGSALDNENTARLNAEATQSAQLRGQTAPVDAYTARANAAQAQRNTALGTMAAATAARGANEYAYLADKNRIGSGQRVQSMLNERSRGREIGEKLLSVKKDQGAAAAKNFNALRTLYLENDLKRKAFGLDRREAEDDTRLKERELSEDERHNRAAEANDRQGSGDNSEQREREQNWNNAMAAARTLFERPKGWNSWGALTKAVMEQSEVSPAMARRAVEKIRAQVEAQEKKAGVAGVKVPW